MREIILRFFMGIGAGILLAVIGFFTRLKASFMADSWPNDLSIFEWVWIILNYPARLLFRLWVLAIRLPPQNDVVVYLVLPSIAILLQWAFIGVLVAIWCAYRQKNIT